MPRRPRPALAAPLAALAACAGTPEAPAPDSGVVEALTYNVAGLPAAVAKVDPFWTMPRIGPLFESYDLVLVQEDFVYHELLAGGAGHPHRSTPMESPPAPVGDGLSRFSRYPFGELSRVRWVACHGLRDHANDCLAAKGFSVATTELAPGVRVDVYNLHCEAGGSTGDREARAAGTAQLRDYILEHSADRAVIVGGDFNMRLRSERDAAVLQDLLEATGLADAATTLETGTDHIDRLLYRSGGGVELAPLAWAVADEFVDEEGARLSDHPAIRVTFAWRRAD